MPKETPPTDNRAPMTEEQIRAATIGELKPLSGPILIVDYDPRWPVMFAREAQRIQAALGDKALRIEHTGSTSVPGLAAKPVIDVVLEVADSRDEDSYVPALEAAGYSLRIRETDWNEHRMFKGPDTKMHLHVFSAGCREIDRMLMFRDGCATIPQIAIYTRAPSWPWLRRSGSMARITPMPRLRSSRRSSPGPASPGNDSRSSRSPATIKNVKVEATYLGGKLVYGGLERGGKLPKLPGLPKIAEDAGINLRRFLAILAVVAIKIKKPRVCVL